MDWKKAPFEKVTSDRHTVKIIQLKFDIENN